MSEYSGEAPPYAPEKRTCLRICSDDTAELGTLASLRDAGVLNEEEFNTKKAQILGL